MTVEQGDRIELVAMPADPDPILAGTCGTVEKVTHHTLGPDEFDQVYVKWDDGRTLMLCVPPDEVRTVAKVSRHYVKPEDVTAIRVYHDGHCWNVDGIDLDGNYTEDCATFPTANEALAHVDEFRKIGIPARAIVVNEMDEIRANAEQIRRLFTKKGH